MPCGLGVVSCGRLHTRGTRPAGVVFRFGSQLRPGDRTGKKNPFKCSMRMCMFDVTSQISQVGAAGIQRYAHNGDQ